jgi:HPt (histidine-containing phosphotransfer) domain-containing protein
LERALAAGDETLFRRSAHSLKGLARSCGAEGVGRVAAELEKLAIETDAARAARLLPDLEADMNATRLALREYHQRALRKPSGQ